jgi:predicted DNA-binding transcriptional regulator AlpA
VDAMTDNANPESVVPKFEVAKVAGGRMPAGARKSSHLSADPEESSLDCLGSQSGHAGPQALQPRGISRIEAARYIGISPSKFDQLVEDKRMPEPRAIDGRVVWDRWELDVAFSDLPHRGSDASDDPWRKVR